MLGLKLNHVSKRGHSSEKYILFGLPSESDIQIILNFGNLHMKIYMYTCIYIERDCLIQAVSIC